MSGYAVKVPGTFDADLPRLFPAAPVTGILRRWIPSFASGKKAGDALTGLADVVSAQQLLAVSSVPAAVYAEDVKWKALVGDYSSDRGQRAAATIPAGDFSLAVAFRRKQAVPANVSSVINASGIYIQLLATSGVLRVGSVSSGATQAQFAALDDAPHVVVFTYDSTTNVVTAWLDGVAAASTGGGAARGTSGDLYIGTSFSGSVSLFQVADTAIWNRKLTAAEAIAFSTYERDLWAA